jgi:hypothetical protein
MENTNFNNGNGNNFDRELDHENKLHTGYIGTRKRVWRGGVYLEIYSPLHPRKSGLKSVPSIRRGSREER